MRESNSPGRRRLISIVTPCWNEEANVEGCYEAVRKVFEERLTGYDYEHLFCDNASSDETVAILRTLAASDPHVKVIVNSRNFGPFRSMFNGIVSSNGDAVLCFLPADLQDPPELLPEFVQRWEAGYEVVYGIRAKREESRVLAAIRRSYYRIVNRFAEIFIPENTGEFQLVDRVVVEALRRYDDYYPYVRGMIANCGFRSSGIEYTWKARRHGLSRNRIWHLVDQALNGLIAFTKVPLRLVLSAGFILSVLSILYAFVTLLLNLLWYRKLAAPGVPSLIVAVFFFAGIQLFVLGLLGEYIGAIHFQVRRGPLVIERERINFRTTSRPEESNVDYLGPA